MKKKSQERDRRAPTSAAPPKPSPEPLWPVLLALAVLTAVVFWPIGTHDFINFDDQDYITGNPQVQRGLTVTGVQWAFRTFSSANWHPLTWISHMVDVSLFGLNSGRHHQMSLLLHVANTLLLFLLLRRLTGNLWPSAWAAALFAVHPLHVESVAWASERKDVLSFFFGLLALYAYTAYTQRREKEAVDSWTAALTSVTAPHYLLALLLYAASLMAKPMLVTLPFLALLLDLWPLKRLRDFRSGLILLVEKVPFLLLAVASSVVTVAAQSSGEAVGALDEFPLPTRLANALVTYSAYLLKTIWPWNLAVFYPYASDGIPLWQTAGAAIAFLCITLVALRSARAKPFFIVGWFWYLGSLVPVIGLVQVGEQAMANRYTYVPLVGIFVALSWGIYGSIGSGANRRLAAAIATAAVLTLAFAARVEVGFWKNSITLFTRALQVTERNGLAHGSLGQALWASGQVEESVGHFRKAVALRPDSEITRNHLGGALLSLRRLDEAEAELSTAIAIRPDYAPAQLNLGLVLSEQGKLGEAIDHFQKAIAADPAGVKAHSSLALALARSGNASEARAHYSHALALDPNDSATHNNLGNLLAREGKPEEALAHYRKAIANKPGDPFMHFNAGVILQRLGRTRDSISEFETALKLKPDYTAASEQLRKVRGN